MTYETPPSAGNVPPPNPPADGSSGYSFDVPKDGAVTGTVDLASSPPPERERAPKGCLAVLAVAAVMIGILVVGAVASDSLANEPPKPINLGHGVSLTAPWSWEYQGRSEDQNTVLLSRGNGSLAVTVNEATDPSALLQGLRDEWESSGTVTTTDIKPVPDLRPGDNVLRFAYTGDFDDIAGAVEGEVTAVATDNVVVVFDGWSGYGDYVTVKDEIETMISGATIP